MEQLNSFRKIPICFRYLPSNVVSPQNLLQPRLIRQFVQRPIQTHDRTGIALQLRRQDSTIRRQTHLVNFRNRDRTSADAPLLISIFTNFKTSLAWAANRLHSSRFCWTLSAAFQRYRDLTAPIRVVNVPSGSMLWGLTSRICRRWSRCD